MPLQYQALMDWPFEPVEETISQRDVMLYALGVGLGADPLDASQLSFVYERNLRALPTMAVVVGRPGFFLQDPRAGVDWKQMLHGEQSLTIHRLLPVGHRVVSHNRVESVVDKGEGRGALVYTSRETRDAETGELLCEQVATLFCRADGGFAGPAGPVRPVHPVPDTAPDVTVDLRTLPQAALIYRLSGDYNPLHADPEIAAAAGFPRPILHGLCTYAVAGHALLGELCDYRPELVRRMDVRFSRPVFPGETIGTEIWREACGRASFRCRVVERDVVVIDNGLFEYSAA